MIIVGAKGFAKELLEILYRDYRYKDIFFYDDVNKEQPDLLFNKFKIISAQMAGISGNFIEAITCCTMRINFLPTDFDRLRLNRNTYSSR